MSTTAHYVEGQGLRRDSEVVALAHGTSHFFHLLIPPLFPWLMRDFNLGYAQVGLLMTVFFVVSGCRPYRRTFRSPFLHRKSLFVL
jgi:FSR family fosmidomycin resistance protein-like MFS transporter